MKNRVIKNVQKRIMRYKIDKVLNYYVSEDLADVRCIRYCTLNTSTIQNYVHALCANLEEAERDGGRGMDPFLGKFKLIKSTR